MIYKLGNQQGTIDPDAFIAPSASIIGDVELHAESSIWFGAVLRGDIERISIGRGSNIQDGSVCHTDPSNPCVVGDYVTVGHMAMLHGCRIGAGSLIGIGAILLNGSVIGSDCMVGAQALVTAGKQFSRRRGHHGRPGQNRPRCDRCGAGPTARQCRPLHRSGPALPARTRSALTPRPAGFPFPRDHCRRGGPTRIKPSCAPEATSCPLRV